MTRTDLANVSCSIARTVAVLGDAWSWLIVRDLSVGISRFDLLHSDLGVSRKVLAERLSRLVDVEIVERAPYQDNPPRYDYALTDKGRGLIPVLVMMVEWGDRWEPSDGGPPMHVHHASCPGSTVTLNCQTCGQAVAPEAISTAPGPGGRAGPGTAIIGRYLTRKRH